MVGAGVPLMWTIRHRHRTVCGADGVSGFQAFPYGFNLPAVAGIDLRRERLDDRRASCASFLVRPDGIKFSDDHPGDGEVIFRYAGKLGLEGLV